MDRDVLADVITEFTASLPRAIGRQLENVDVFVCANPEEGSAEIKDEFEDTDDEGKAMEPLPADCKGVFVGEPLEQEEDEDTEGMVATIMPDGMIVLCANNLANAEEAALILLHEIGHALGLDEDEVRQLGLGVQMGVEAAQNPGVESRHVPDAGPIPELPGEPSKPQPPSTGT